MQFGRGKPSAGAFIDSDFRSMDSVLAISLLYGLQTKNDCRVAMLAMTRPDLKTAAYIDLVNRFYHGPAGNFNQLQPVGMRTEGAAGETPAPFVSVFDRKKADGTPAYQNHVKRVLETGDPETLYRNYMQAQYDQNAFFLLAGPATNLIALLDFRGAKDLISAKAKYLVFADPENNAKLDIVAARRLFTEWPTPIVTVGADIGAALPFPGAAIDKEFAAMTENPVADAYRAWKAMPYDIPAPSMAAALYAGRPKENYFKVSENGSFKVGDDGKPVFSAGAQGKHQYLIADPAQKEKILKDYVELASAKPAPPFRFRPNAAAADKDKEADPANKVVVVPPKQ